MARNEPFSALDDVIQTFNAVTKRRMWKGKIAFTVHSPDTEDQENMKAL